MLKKLLVIPVIIALSFSTIACEKSDYNNSENNEYNSTQLLNSTKKAADFSLKTPDGKIVKLSDYKNKIVIIDFWATWCPPCRKGIPDLIAIQKEYKDDVVVIGISLDRDNTIADVAPFIKNYGINYPVVFGNMEVVKAYGGVEAIPTSFIVDKKGNIVDTHVGLVPKETYTSLIKSLLKK
ncbi:MAG: TlpA family protein disulfide reductase [Ignavibacteriaceae bacterium]|nr:TlpA family protein disulfide reductase [Ignavibacteriaceae bacterium]